MDERLQKYSFLENPKYGYEQTHFLGTVIGD